MTGQGEPHLPRLFTPGVAVLLGYVLLVGNPWLNRDLQIALSDSEPAFRLGGVLLSYPSWYVDVDRIGPFLFWYADLRTLLFVALAVAGLVRVPRWVSEKEAAGLFVITVGLTTLSAVIAGLGSSAITLILLDSREAMPYIGPDRPEEFLLSQLGPSAVFGLLFGLVLGAVVVMQHRAPAGAKRRVNTPKSFW